MASHEQIFARWMNEAPKPEPKFLRGSRHTGLHVTADGVLAYERTEAARRTASPFVRLAHWIGGRNGTLLMNAEAFADWHATRWQNNIRSAATRGRPATDNRTEWRYNRDLRRHVQTEIANSAIPAVKIVPPERRLLVPFAALDAAQIDFDTVKPIHITEDTNEIQRIPLRVNPFPTMTPEWLRRRLRSGEWRQTQHNRYEGEWRGYRWALTLNGMLYGRPPLVDLPEEQFERVSIRDVNVWERPEHGAHGLQRVDRNPDGSAVWIANVHRMGASLFSAVGPNGRRNKYVSAFDQNEPSPLYYLAMLPPCGARTVDDAIQALAPPIVHAAWEKSIHVERQGDVFAIQTNLTDEQVYEGALTRVRREIVLQTPQPNTQLVPPAPGEVREKHTCPHCGEFTWMGFGPRARRALMIHNTGHTADEVVVKRGGVTYIKGRMHHDPALETEGRRPDHIFRDLEHGRWYLAVRNTVPRQRNRQLRAITGTGRRPRALREAA